MNSGRTLPRKLTETELETVLEAPASELDRAILEVAYGCGLRYSELCGLTLTQMKLEARFINVIGKGFGVEFQQTGRRGAGSVRRERDHGAGGEWAWEERDLD